MSADPYRDLVPAAALGALDPGERASFEAHVASCPGCRGELLAFEATAHRIPMALTPVPPSPAARRRILSQLQPVPSRQWLLPALAAAAAVVCALGLWVVRGERESARQELARARGELAGIEKELASTRQGLEEAKRLNLLLYDPESRLSSLAGLPAAPSASGRVVWNPALRQAVLLARGLPPAPAGRVYEAWVIADAGPVPAGLFQVDKDGRGMLQLPSLAEMSRAKTFAVTLEPAAGTPAPTGPMVLAGAAS